MPRPCTICTHKDRAAIDKALVTGTACREIAALYRVSPDAVERHNAAHLAVRLVKAQEVEEVAQADDLLSQVRSLQQRALTILDAAEQSGDLRTALGAIGQARSNLELLAKLLGQIDDRPQVNVLVMPEWLSLRGVIPAALAPYPQARAAVAARLAEREA